MFFFIKHAENATGRLVPDPFLFYKTALYGASGQHLSYYILHQYILIVLDSDIQQKQTVYNLRLLIHKYAQFLNFSVTNFSTAFGV